MGTLLGAVIGGTLWTWLFGLGTGLAFRRLHPGERALAAAFSGWIVLAILVSFTLGFGMALLYIPGAVFGYLLLRRRYREAWVDDDETEELPA